MPWSWALNVDAGGGLLNNFFTHHLGMLATITGGEPVRAMGRAQAYRGRAPVAPDAHDFRHLVATGRALTPETAGGLERRDFEADLGYAAILEFQSTSGVVPVTEVAGPGVPFPSEGDGWRIYGEDAALHVEASPSPVISRRKASAEPERLPIPQRLLDDVPCVGDNVQNWWCVLARDFVADIRGEDHRPYLTFCDGWRYQVAIDALRAGRGWTELPA
jgi:predicted dehydrogenase